MNTPRYIFFGSPDFAVVVLEKLLGANLPPVAVVCGPDKPVGRKQELTAPAVKRLIANRDDCRSIPLFQPRDTDELTALKQTLADYNPDFFVIAAYAHIISQHIIDIPRLGTIGVHPSLLPRYRGASPIQAAILNGDETTGVTLYLVDDKMDHGPILAQKEWPIDPRDTYQALERKLAELGGDALAAFIPSFMKGDTSPNPQAHDQATFTKKFKTEDGFVEPQLLADAQSGNDVEAARAIEQKIRALGNEPGVWTYGFIANGKWEMAKEGEGKRIKLLEAESREGRLVLKKAQVEGKTPQLISA